MIMIDKIETFGKSVFQHGRHNNRVYLMTLHADDSVRIIPYLDDLALSRGYTKIFAKVPLSAKNLFLEHDYAVEASIPGFYAGKETALFMGKYFCRQRQEERRPELVEEIIRTAQEKGAHGGASKRHEAKLCRRAEEQDVEEMAGLYREVFATYPFPIHDPAYLKTTMTKSVVYFGIWQEGRLLALASADCDADAKAAEMTDFATRVECRGQGLAGCLLDTMEKAMHAAGIRTAFTIARAYSFGMNITFAQKGYHFDGTLTNNTNISGHLESMNVWHKKLG
jgi:putative beta-lysine N-acetyltransferase